MAIDKTLTLLGAQAGVDARSRPFVPGNESIIEHPCGPVQIEANKVVLDGFTVQGSTLPDPCFLSGIWTNPGFSGTDGGHQILNNIVQNNISGIELDSTCVYATLVRFNLIQNNSNPGPGKATGGGKIQSDPTGLDLVLELATMLMQQSSNPTSVGSQATFGFSVSCCAPKGNLEYNDHQANVRIKAISIETFVISMSTACPTGKHAQFKGQANETKMTGTQQVGFTVDVDDCGEPGSSTAGGADMFKIQTFDHMAAGPLIGGNIQIHAGSQ